MATRTKKDSVQLSLTIDGKPAEDTLSKLDEQNEKLVRQLMDLKEAGKENTEQYRKLKEAQQDVLKQSNEMYENVKKAAERQAKFAVNENKSLKELNREYRQLRAIVSNLPEEHKDFNQQVELLHKKKAKIDEMRKLFRGVKEEVKESAEHTGNLKDGMVNVGDLVTGGLITGGVFAAVDLAERGVDAVADMVEEMGRLRREINQVTNATGGELDEQAVRIQAISKTFELEQKEVLQAANAIRKEFNVSTGSAFDLMEEGLIAGADLSGEFLANIQEYSVQFSAAKFSAEEFVAVSTRASKEGIYSDKGLDVVKEFGIRIREQTTAAKDALVGAFGSTFTERLFQNINDGSITTVDALKLVSTEMNDTEIPARELQTVIADVFGGPGEDAGLRYIQMLKDVQSETVNLIDPTNQYVEAQMAQLAANQELARSQNDLTKQLEDTGNSLSVFWATVRSGAINVLVDVLQFFERFSATWKGIGAGVKQFFLNRQNELEDFVIDIKLKFAEVRKLNPFGDTDTQIDEDIAALRNRKAELATEAKSVGQAYRDAFLEGLDEIELRKKAAQALNVPNGNVPSGDGNFKGESAADIKAKKEAARLAELQAEREKNEALFGEMQSISQLEIQQLQFTETEKKRIKEEGDSHASELVRKEMDRVARLEEFKRQQAEETANKKAAVEKLAISVAEDAFQTTISLLSADEAARKKNVKAIKGFKTAQVFTNLFEEISAIWKNANSSPANILFPGAGTAIATAQTFAASTRAQLQVSKIQKQKYERGGIAQGASHAQGGIQLWDSASGQVVGEMEGGEPYMILSKATYGNNRSIVDSLLHSSMYMGGAPIFRDGGIFRPQVINSQTNLNQSTDRLEQLQAAQLRESIATRQAIELIPTTLKAEVPVQTINRSNETLGQVRKAASV